jgi:hypothetical protein
LGGRNKREKERGGEGEEINIRRVRKKERGKIEREEDKKG